MKRALSLIAALLLTSTISYGQAFLQIVHNSPDPLLDSIDVIITSPGGVFDTTMVNLNFREVTTFLPVASGLNVSIQLTVTGSGAPLGPVNTLSDTLAAGSRTVLQIAGVVSGSFDPNPEGRATSADYFIDNDFPLTGVVTGAASFSLFHGVTDLQTVDIKMTGPGFTSWVADDLSYGEFVDSIITVPAIPYMVEIYDSTRSTLLKTFYGNLASAAAIPGGALATFFLSGVVNTTQGPEYNMHAGIAGFPTGQSSPLRIVETAQLQIIHNSADPAAQTVDVYVISTIDSSEVGFADDMSFREATEAVSVPSFTPFRIVVAPSSSTGLIDALANALYSVPVTELTTDKSYVWMLNGLDNSASFDPNPDGEATDLMVYRRDTLTQTTAAGRTNILFFNGVTDAANFDADLSGSGSLAQDLLYGKFAGYINVASSAGYGLTVSGGNLAYSYSLDLSALGGQRVVLFSSGFLDSTQNFNAAFDIWAALEDGTTYSLTPGVVPPLLTAVAHSNDTLICPGTLINLDAIAYGGQAPFTYLWSGPALTATTGANVTAASASIGYFTYTVVVTDSLGTTYTSSIGVTVDSCTGVWPGDADDDGVVDLADVLSIGQLYGANDFARANASIAWTEQPGVTWRQLFNGVDYKFRDCDGNGVVNDDDTLAVSQNWALTHAKAGAQAGPNDPLLYLQAVNSNSTLYSNASAQFDIMLGTSAQPVSNMYGIAFTMDLDPAVFDLSTATIDMSNSFMGTDVFSFRKLDTDGINIAVSRTDQQNTNGYGKIGTLTLRTLDISAPGTVDLAPVIVKGVSANGSENTYNVQTTTVILDSSVGIAQIDVYAGLSVYPNPTKDVIHIQAGSIKSSSWLISLTTMDGRTVQEEMLRTELNSHIINTSGLAAGVYFLRLTGDEGTAVRKVVVQ